MGIAHNTSSIPSSIAGKKRAWLVVIRCDTDADNRRGAHGVSWPNWPCFNAAPVQWLAVGLSVPPLAFRKSLHRPTRALVAPR
jgi:hypothetical protein